MKKILKFTTLSAILLILVGSLASCEVEDKEWIGGEVAFELCPHEFERGSEPLIEIKGEAYLFYDSIPDAMKEKLHQESKANRIAWIVYEGNNMATLYVSTQYETGKYFYSGIYDICNFPDFVKQWELPLTGQKIYYEGKAYYLGGYACSTCTQFYDLGLTIFKKK